MSTTLMVVVKPSMGWIVLFRCSNFQLSLATIGRIPTHTHSIFKSLHRLKINKTVPSMPPRVHLILVLPRKLPLKDLSTISKLCYDCISCAVEIDIVDIDFKAWFAFAIFRIWLVLRNGGLWI